MKPLYVVATRTDFLVGCVVRRRRAFRGLKISFDEIERNVHSFFFDFLGRGFLWLSAKRCLSKSRPYRPSCPISASEKLGQHLGRENKCV